MFLRTVSLSAVIILATLPLAAGTGSKSITVLHMSDTHAALDAHPEIFFDTKGGHSIRRAGGMALLASAIDEQRAKYPQSILVNVGDTFHGSAVGAFTEGAAIVPVINALGIDAFVPGNWDFAYGPGAFRKRMQELTHQVIAINLREAKSGRRLFSPSLVREIDGVKVAIVGVTSVIVDKTMAPDYAKGLKFSFREGLQDEVDRLRKEGAAIVILATELGLAQETRLAREIRGVDFILGGHTHERTDKPVVIGGVPVIQSGSEGSFLGRVTFEVVDGKVAGYQHELLEVTADRYAPKPAVQKLVDEARAPFRKQLESVVGNTEVDLFRKGILESNVDNFIADSVREASGADIGIANGFRFSYPVPKGRVTEEDLYNLLPMDANVKVGTITGKQLREFWEKSLDEVFARDAYGQKGGWGPRVSGMEVRIRLAATSGERIVWMKVGGKPVRDDATYTIASCERPGDGAGTLCRFEGARNTKTLPVTIQSAMRNYLVRHGTIRPAEGRVTAQDVHGEAWSQYELTKTIEK
ncbi:MAG: bifunctional metallophosphatase/5'-nucleotidase [Thermoanaerobaculia bacterium]